MEPPKDEAQKGESINDQLRAVIEPLQTVIREANLPDYDGTLKLDERYHDVESTQAGVGNFSFWGSIEPQGIPQLPAEPTAVIKRLWLLHGLRKEELEASVVKTWEKVLSEKGVRVFAATNIRDNIAKNFWKGLGYESIPSETRDIPYVMYKTVPTTPAAAPTVQ